MWGPLLDGLIESALCFTTVFPTEGHDSLIESLPSLETWVECHSTTSNDIWSSCLTNCQHQNTPTPTPIVFYSGQWRTESCQVTVETHLSCVTNWQNTTSKVKVRQQDTTAIEIPSCKLQRDDFKYVKDSKKKHHWNLILHVKKGWFFYYVTDGKGYKHHWNFILQLKNGWFSIRNRWKRTRLPLKFHPGSNKGNDYEYITKGWCFNREQMAIDTIAIEISPCK